MGDADELLFVTEGDNAMPVLKPDRARGPEARYGEANKFIEENAVVRVASAFWHELKATPRRPMWYHDTTYECQSIEAPQGWGGLRDLRRERLSVASRREATVADRYSERRKWEGKQS